ncbi:hypothetical protein M422DRAFT_158155, partial [Sphaerobolus stellatus SS14]
MHFNGTDFGPIPAALPPGILNTNYIPSPEEEYLIRKTIISQHTQRLQELDVRVEEAKKVLRELEREQRKEMELLQAHRALLSPMRRLIPDLLLEIFRHCHALNNEIPMRLASVCRQWRDFIKSTPTFWTV